jgi:hypothetical protein
MKQNIAVVFDVNTGKLGRPEVANQLFLKLTPIEKVPSAKDLSLVGVLTSNGFYSWGECPINQFLKLEE